MREEEFGVLPVARGAAEDAANEDDDEGPIYNPLNLPLGWDGKPIPFWLYKLHGLGVEYKCEICGNQSYWGRKAFDRHFQEWKHAHGMRCLGTRTYVVRTTSCSFSLISTCHHWLTYYYYYYYDSQVSPTRSISTTSSVSKMLFISTRRYKLLSTQSSSPLMPTRSSRTLKATSSIVGPMKILLDKAYCKRNLTQINIPCFSLFGTVVPAMPTHVRQFVAPLIYKKRSSLLRCSFSY